MKVELCSSKALIPLPDFLSATRSIYDPGWLPFRIARFVAGKPLWWALGQLGFVDSHNAAFGDSGTAERWKKVRGDYVAVSLLESAAERIVEKQRQKSTGQVADTLYNVESFRADFAGCAFDDAALSALDVKVVLKYLERDKGMLVVHGEVCAPMASFQVSSLTLCTGDQVRGRGYRTDVRSDHCGHWHIGIEDVRREASCAGGQSTTSHRPVGCSQPLWSILY